MADTSALRERTQDQVLDYARRMRKRAEGAETERDELKDLLDEIELTIWPVDEIDDATTVAQVAAILTRIKEDAG